MSTVIGPVSVVDKVWVLEVWRQRSIARVLREEDLQKMGITDTWEWGLIMNPRDLETAMQWCKRKTEEGMTVRIRNLVTDDVIMGAILGEYGTDLRANDGGG